MFSFYLSPFVAKIDKKVSLSAGYADVEYCKSICGMKTKGLSLLQASLCLILRHGFRGELRP